MSDAREFEQLLEKVQRENDMRHAFIAGVGEGIEIACEEERPPRDVFETEVREAFRDFLSEYDE